MTLGVDKKIVTWAALTAAALLVSGCGGTAGADSGTAPARPAASPPPAAAEDKAPGGSAERPGGGAPDERPGGSAERPGGSAEAAAAYRKWGLKPFAAPPAPPRTKPVTRKPGGPVPVISEIPTQDRVVFITIDDGAEKDPAFVRMMEELNVPVTMFLTDSAIRADYGYFKPLTALGNGVANHTLTHPNLRTLGRSAQRQEICGQQRKLAEEYGTTPRLFRPPYGNWNEDTRAAAAECGVDAIVLWRESMQIKNMRYQRGDRKLHPGDIILAHFRGPAELKGTSMTRMTANMLRHIQAQGFTVARLEDYV